MLCTKGGQRKRNPPKAEERKKVIDMGGGGVAMGVRKMGDEHMVLGGGIGNSIGGTKVQVWGEGANLGQKG